MTDAQIIAALREALEAVQDSGLLHGSYNIHDEMREIVSNALSLVTDKEPTQ